MRKKKETHKAPDSVSQSVREVKLYQEKLAEMLHNVEDQLIDDFSAKHGLGVRKEKHIAVLECPICWKNLGEVICGCRFGYDHTMIHNCSEHRNMTAEEQRRHWGETEVVGQYKGFKIIVMNYYTPLGAGSRSEEKTIVFDRRFYEALMKAGRMDLYNKVLEHETTEWEISAKLHKKQGIELNDFTNTPLKEEIVTEAHRIAETFDQQGFKSELENFCQRNISKYYHRENNQIKMIICTAFTDYISSNKVLPETRKSLMAILEKEFGRRKS